MRRTGLHNRHCDMLQVETCTCSACCCLLSAYPELFLLLVLIHQSIIRPSFDDLLPVFHPCSSAVCCACWETLALCVCVCVQTAVKTQRVCTDRCRVTPEMLHMCPHLERRCTGEPRGTTSSIGTRHRRRERVCVVT